MLQQASNDRALAPADHPQLQRLRYIASAWCPSRATAIRAPGWRWEVNLIGSRQINAFCMPGGKIAFYFGILAELQLSDDEVAMIMGHEAAHALLEHAREQMGKNVVTRAPCAGRGAARPGQPGRPAGAQVGGQLLTLKFSRDDESEADAWAWCWRPGRLRPALRRHAVAEDDQPEPRRAAGDAVHPPRRADAHQGHRGEAAARAAAVRRRSQARAAASAAGPPAPDQPSSCGRAAHQRAAAAVQPQLSATCR
jgi:hypothetical protein